MIVSVILSLLSSLPCTQKKRKSYICKLRRPISCNVTIQADFKLVDW